jgi:hypothetical protein
MRSRRSGDTSSGVFSARDTDTVDTPARRATSSSFTDAPFDLRDRRDRRSKFSTVTPYHGTDNLAVKP